jgi:hypothetical protein
MAVDWEVLGMGSTARIVATCESCHVSIESNIAAPVEAVNRLFKFKHCRRIDTPPPQIQESLLELSKATPDTKEIKRHGVRWL